MKSSHVLVAKLLNPFYQAQQILARLLHLRPVELTQLAPEEQDSLLDELVTTPTTETGTSRRTVKLLALWSAGLGYKPWHQQPHSQLAVVLDPQPTSWARYLSDSAQYFGPDVRHAWVLLEINVCDTRFPVSTRRLRYVLLPLIDCVHHHAEHLAFNSVAA